jgi:hypothetical protein
MLYNLSKFTTRNRFEEFMDVKKRVKIQRHVTAVKFN